jgi:predicted dithiol-disulfide oxidoreductase (DUF899 family)
LGGVAGALAKLQAYKRQMGWTFPWASSFGGDFNFDFNVHVTEEQQRQGGIEYNYRREGRFAEPLRTPVRLSSLRCPEPTRPRTRAKGPA